MEDCFDIFVESGYQEDFPQSFIFYKGTKKI
jgi:hypothetical protein